MKRHEAVPKAERAAEPAPPGSDSSSRQRHNQGVAVAMDWLAAEGVLTLVAVTLKRADDYLDRWSVSPSLPLASTTLDDSCFPGERSFVSRACASVAALIPDTTYTFGYSIAMRSGETSWYGSGTAAVTIGPDGSVARVSTSSAGSPDTIEI